MATLSCMRSLSLDSIVLASPQQISCDVADEAVLLSMKDGEYYGLNEVAASIWRQIQEPRTVAQVRDALLEEYDSITKAECEQAVFAFLREMVELNLVELR
jgi:hypothetical protein